MLRHFVGIGVITLAACGQGEPEQAQTAIEPAALATVEDQPVDHGPVFEEITNDVGDPPEPADSVAQAVRIIVLPDGYGKLAADGSIAPQGITDDRCYRPDWLGPGSRCMVPGDKVVRVKNFSAGTGLPDIDWAARVNSALGHFNAQIAGSGWAVSMDSSGGDVMTLETPGGTALAETSQRFKASDCIRGPGDAANRLCFTRGGCKFRFSTSRILAQPSFTIASPRNQATYVENVILHELYHCIGLGHFPSPSAGVHHILNAGPTTSPLAASYFLQILNITDADYWMVSSFKP